jgi:hypothetical protein
MGDNMNINSISNRALGDMQLSASKTDNQKIIEFTQEKQDPLEYYKALCSEFPDITFRLEDYEEHEKNPTKIILGYQDSFNQVGNNFSDLDQCSIVIDVAVIRHMQKDPQYAQQVRGVIESTKREHRTFTTWTMEEGMDHCERILKDGSDHVITELTMHRGRASTEDEIKSMWNMQGVSKTFYDKNIQMKFDAIQKDMFDNFLEMTQSHNKYANLKSDR